jgi:hypothetical protein
LEVVTFIVELVPGAGLGLKVVTAPAGRPVAERLMDSLNPPVRLMFTVYGAVVEVPLR